MMTTPFFPLPEGIEIERSESATNQLHIWLVCRHQQATVPVVTNLPSVCIDVTVERLPI